jgi:uncharacterized membrane-anchored protein
MVLRTLGAPSSTILAVLLALGLSAGPVRAQEASQATPQAADQIQVEAGPGTFPVGSDLAEIDLAQGYRFLGAEASRKYMELLQNTTDGSEMATVLPPGEANWFVIFEWDEMGWVDDKDSDLDQEAILTSIREGTEAANEQRKERGWETFEVVGWHEAPHYDARTHNLTWAIIGASGGERTVNRIVKLLGRRGVMTATLVAGPAELDAAAAETDKLLEGYRFRSGSTYAEYVPGTDRMAEVGLAALVIGGGGAALVKSGLLARFWKLIVFGGLAAAAAVRRFFQGTRAEDQPITRA